MLVALSAIQPFTARRASCASAFGCQLFIAASMRGPPTLSRRRARPKFLLPSERSMELREVLGGEGREEIARDAEELARIRGGFDLLVPGVVRGAHALGGLGRVIH